MIQHYDQLDFFESLEVIRLRRQVENLKESLNKMRKALFARDNDRERRCQELELRLNILEKYLVCGGYDIRKDPIKTRIRIEFDGALGNETSEARSSERCGEQILVGSGTS